MFDVNGLRLVGVKTTCKDRWRQVLSEGRRPGLPRFILTLQKGVSTRQMEEMRGHGLSLVVPQPLHDHFAPSDRPHLLSVAEFLAHA
ncbi:type II restriction endonuclease [Janibacter limosus]|uniref:type II restriction endonuclease n=1 Tax=Janibacter limosus TaxID=53458 RepID=UPI0035DB807A